MLVSEKRECECCFRIGSTPSRPEMNDDVSSTTSLKPGSTSLTFDCISKKYLFFDLEGVLRLLLHNHDQGRVQRSIQEG